jgi:hypothetical protein
MRAVELMRASADVRAITPCLDNKQTSRSNIPRLQPKIPHQIEPPCCHIREIERSRTARSDPVGREADLGDKCWIKESVGADRKIVRGDQAGRKTACI